MRSAWNDGVQSDGRNEWIEARFDRRQVFRGVRFTTGWDCVSRHGTDLFYGNNRIRLADVSVDGAFVRSVEAQDGAREAYASGFAVEGYTLRITVRDVFPGSHWADTAIGEIAISAE